MYAIYKLYHRLMWVSVALFLTSTIHAQNEDAVNAFTPYSFYGIGDLTKPGSAYNLSMGGIGTGVRTSHEINFVNPAALTAHDSLSFMFDFGLQEQNYYAMYYSTDGKKHTTAANNMNIQHIIMSFPVHSRVVLGIGLLPYSSTGYKIQDIETDPAKILNMGNVYYNYTGEGYINEAAFSLGLKINKYISLGGKAQYYFGTIRRYTNIDFASNTSYSNLVSGYSLKIRNMGFTIGAQYEQPFNNDLSLVIGATYALANKMGAETTNFAYTQTGSLKDTILLQKEKDNTTMPTVISGGISIRKVDHWLAGIDYVYQDWSRSGLVSPASSVQFKALPAHLLRTGVEWIPSKNDFRNYFNRCSYRIGFNYEKTYMQFKNTQISGISATIGAGLPINRWNNAINLSAEVGKRGTTDYGLIREIYLKFSVSFSIYDIWFIKQRIE